MKPLSRRERIGLWFVMNDGWGTGLVIGGVGLLVAAAVFAIMIPVGPESNEAGTVEAFGLLETDQGTRGRVVVQTDSGRKLTVHAPEGHRCRIGDRVVVVDEAMIWGKASRLRRTGCAV